MPGRIDLTVQITVRILKRTGSKAFMKFISDRAAPLRRQLGRYELKCSTRCDISK